MFPKTAPYLSYENYLISNRTSLINQNPKMFPEMLTHLKKVSPLIKKFKIASKTINACQTFLQARNKKHKLKSMSALSRHNLNLEFESVDTGEANVSWELNRLAGLINVKALKLRLENLNVLACLQATIPVTWKSFWHYF